MESWQRQHQYYKQYSYHGIITEMKRTKHIHKERFRKKRIFWHYSFIFTGVLSVGFFLTRCDTPSTETTKEYLSRPFTSAVDCYSNSDFSYDQCSKLKEQSINDAIQNSKNYKNKIDCENDYPDTECDIAQNGTPSAHYYPYPNYFGYNHNSSQGKAFYSRGTTNENFRSLSGEKFNPKTSGVALTKTSTRGGFGSSTSPHHSHSSFHSHGG
ncbi:DUF1190 domain-containing protein [Hafnia paralvei]|jgi:uncharacterized protein YgiB involved in biofilm formation|nr:DUF1190 domain-containing protein [Hafnia paralvei]MCE9947438.1 DUF1190 domain-containing protein [Hafnia paralvei]